jgi:hypothetical protein
MAKRSIPFWACNQGMNVVNAIAKDDVIKVTITRKGTLKKFDAPKYSLIIF